MHEGGRERKEMHGGGRERREMHGGRRERREIHRRGLRRALDAFEWSEEGDAWERREEGNA